MFRMFDKAQAEKIAWAIALRYIPERLVKFIGRDELAQAIELAWLEFQSDEAHADPVGAWARKVSRSFYDLLTSYGVRRRGGKELLLSDLENLSAPPRAEKREIPVIALARELYRRKKIGGRRGRRAAALTALIVRDRLQGRFWRDIAETYEINVENAREFAPRALAALGL